MIGEARTNTRPKGVIETDYSIKIKVHLQFETSKWWWEPVNGGLMKACVDIAKPLLHTALMLQKDGACWISAVPKNRQIYTNANHNQSSLLALN
jgi:hypothetical protein